MSAAISAKNLGIRYRTHRGNWLVAVQDLSFEIREGESVGFLGPNGAGKSSTLKALMGFVEPSAGECRIFGLPAGSVEAKGFVGYLPEVALYYPFLNPLETMELYGQLQGMRGRALRNEASELLALVGLKDAMRKQNRSLSKGMLQRVGIAQSLLGGPRLLILDEVTSGLDPIGRHELRELLRGRQKAGTTLFFSSHELAEVEQLCDRVLLIHKGKLVEERDMTQLRASLRRYEVTFRSKGGTTLEFLASTTETRTLGDGSSWARFEDKQEMLVAIEQVQDHGGKVVDVVSEDGSLETYFIERVQEAA